MTVNVNIDINNILKKRGLGKDKGAQRFLVETVERLSQPYVLISAGSGAHMVNMVHRTDHTLVYTSPYAHYQYYGEVMAGRAPKHYMGVPIDYHGGPMRGKEWNKRMMADRKRDVERALDVFIRQRGR